MMRRFVIVATLLVVARCCAADVVEMRDGRTLRGRVLNCGELERATGTFPMVRLLPDGPGQPVVPIARQEVLDVILERKGVCTVYHLAPASALGSETGWWQDASSPTWGWISVLGSFDAYSMSDLNGTFDEVNPRFATAHFDHVSHGPGLGAGGGVRFGPGRDVGVEFERVLGKSEASDATGRVEIDVPASLFRVSGRFGWPLGHDLAAGLGAGIGIARPSGTFRIVDSSGASAGSHSTAIGLLAEGEVFGETPIVGPWDACLALGYRHARVSGVESIGTELDYSGVFARVAVVLLLRED